MESHISVGESDTLAPRFTYAFIPEDATEALPLPPIAIVGTALSAAANARRPCSCLEIPSSAMKAMATMERQYWTIKSEVYDAVVFFQKGHFFEVYDTDAVLAHREFGLRMTVDTTNRGHMRMAGVPEAAVEDWARLFLYRGHKVAIVKQISGTETTASSPSPSRRSSSSPRGATIIRREITQILTRVTALDGEKSAMRPSGVSDEISPSPTTIDEGSSLSWVIAIAVGHIPSNNGYMAWQICAVDIAQCRRYICPMPQISIEEAVNLDISAPHAALDSLRTLFRQNAVGDVIIPDGEAILALAHINNNSDSRLKVAVGRMWGVARYIAELALVGTTGRMEYVSLRDIDSLRCATLSMEMKGSTFESAGGHMHAPLAWNLMIHYFSYLRHPFLTSLRTSEWDMSTDHLDTTLDPTPLGDDRRNEGVDGVRSADDEAMRVWACVREDRGVFVGGAALDALHLTPPPASPGRDVPLRWAAFANVAAAVGAGAVGAAGRAAVRRWVQRPLSRPAAIAARQAAVRGLAERPDAAMPSVESPKRPRDGGGTAFRGDLGSDVPRWIARIMGIAHATDVDGAQVARWSAVAMNLISGIERLAKGGNGLMVALEQGAWTHGCPPLLRAVALRLRRCQRVVEDLATLYSVDVAKKTGVLEATADENPGNQALRIVEGEMETFVADISRRLFGGSRQVRLSIREAEALMEIPRTLADQEGASRSMADNGLKEHSRTAALVRFSCNVLGSLMERRRTICNAGRSRHASTLRLVAARILLHVGTILDAAAAWAEWDAIGALAQYSSQIGGTFPIIEESSLAYLEARCLRHPLLIDGVGNDTKVGSGEQRILLLTGPNMSGKSTWMRTIALGFVLGQIGAALPALGPSRLSPVARILTRLGAHDSWMSGLSTLGVELTEASTMLQTPCAKTLCIVDELGRGTSTHDGTAIAASVLEFFANYGHVNGSGLHSHVTPLVLFSTHYHALAYEFVSHPRVSCIFVDYAVDEGGNVRFLYNIRPGVCERSYGTSVALSSGIPPRVVADAVKQSDRLATTVAVQQQIHRLRLFLHTFE